MTSTRKTNISNSNPGLKLETRNNKPTIELPRNCPSCDLPALECLLEGENCWPFTTIPRISQDDMRFLDKSQDQYHGGSSTRPENQILKRAGIPPQER